MKTLSTIFLALLGLVLLVALALGGYFAVTWAAGVFSKLDGQLATITAIASLVILLAAIIVASSVRRTSRQHQAHPFRKERAATYQFFADVWGTLLQPGREPEEPGTIRLSEERQALDRLLTLYGSPQVVKAHIALRILERDLGPHSPAVRSQFAHALIELRTDLGSAALGLSVEEIQQLFFAATNRAGTLATTSAAQDLQPRVSLGANS
jgi:hypothetical protein